MQKRVGRFVAKVLRQAGTRVGVNDAVLALGQEKSPPRRKLGKVKLEKMLESISVVEDVDLDRDRLVRSGGSRGVASGRARGPASSRRPAAHRTWENSRRSRMGRIGPGGESAPAAAPCPIACAARRRQDHDQRPERTHEAVAGERLVVDSALQCLDSPSRQENGRPRRALRLDLSSHRSFDRAPEALPVAERR